MTDTKKGNISARILIIALAVALAVMLGASLKARFQNPHLTVAARQQQGMGGMKLAKTPRPWASSCVRWRKIRRISALLFI